MPVLASYKARRRALWTAAVLVVAGAAAAAIVALPKSTSDRVTHLSGPSQVVRAPPSVPVTAARRQAVNDLLDAFVPAAVERQKPLRALPLVTHTFRAGVTRDDWARGKLPVFPYDTRTKNLHSWRLNYSYPSEISVELMLHPAAKEPLGPVAFTAVFKQVHRRWLIDSFVTSASFAPQKAPKVVAAPDFEPLASDRGKAQLPAHWLLVPAAVLALALLVPVGFGLARLRRSRRAWQAYHRPLE
jgi:hypothetical protein